MLTRARTQEMRTNGLCIGCNGAFFANDPRLHHLCSACGCSATLQKRPNFLTEAMESYGFAYGDDDILAAMHLHVSAKLNIQELVVFMINPCHKKRLYSAAAIKSLRARIYAKTIFWEQPNFTDVIDAILLTCCHEPDRFERGSVSSTAVCYFGNTGEPFHTRDEAARFCRQYYLVASCRGPFLGDDLYSFAKSMYH